jgi:hypothetical protein
MRADGSGQDDPDYPQLLEALKTYTNLQKQAVTSSGSTGQNAAVATPIRAAIPTNPSKFRYSPLILCFLQKSGNSI